MAISRMLASFLPGAVLRFAGRLRFPQLFLLCALLFALDFLVPDFIPFVDEIFLGLMTLAFASLKKRKDKDGA